MLTKSIVKIRASWEPETTENNLSLIRQGVERRDRNQSIGQMR